MSDGTIKLICFSGAGRCGSTLLARLLGEVPGLRTIGEGIGYSLDAHIRSNNRLCSCGEPVESCRFWEPLIRENPDAFTGRAGDLIRLRGLPLLLLPWKPRAVREHLDAMGQRAEQFLRSVQTQIGTDVIVDSTKNPAFVHILSARKDIDLNVIHLVRDARGFVFSRSKPKGNLKRIHPVRAAVVWSLRNWTAGLTRHRAARSWRIRYEDFVREPAHYLDRIVRGVTGRSGELGFIRGPLADVSRQHMLAGNPDKFVVSRLTIEEREWRLSRGLNLVVSTLTLPLLLRYGYLRRLPAKRPAA